MELVSHIITLLNKNGRVIVPQFGEFFLSKSSAKLQIENGRLLPPSKIIGCIIQYTLSDNELTQYIANQEGVSNREAALEVQKQTDFWKNILDKDGRLAIENLGEIAFEENQTHFTGKSLPDLSPDFYGLEAVDIQEKSFSNFKKNKEGMMVDPGFNRFILWTFLVIIPFLALVFLGIKYQTFLFGKKSLPEISVQTSTKRISEKKINDSVRIKSATETNKIHNNTTQ